MSRSRKKAIYKDVSYKKRVYHRIVRSNINQHVRNSYKLESVDDLVLPNPKEIINDYDYCDWSVNWEHDTNPENNETRKQFRRK